MHEYKNALDTSSLESKHKIPFLSLGKAILTLFSQEDGCSRIGCLNMRKFSVSLPLSSPHTNPLYCPPPPLPTPVIDLSWAVLFIELKTEVANNLVWS